MVKYALKLEYNGHDFYGWQTQRDVVTIQATLEQALSKFANQPINVVTAGRTDAGVHAAGQVVHFISDAKRQLRGWVCGVNSLLPQSIRVKEAVIVEDNFDARFSAHNRTYQYYLLLDQVRPAILNGLVGWYHLPLDLAVITDALKLLVGSNDFSSFRASECQANSPVRELMVADLDVRGKMLRFTFKANAFLYHMIRNIIGAMIHIGNHKLNLQQFENLIAAKNRKFAPPTFMPDGLYFVDVEYALPLFASTFKPEEWLFG